MPEVPALASSEIGTLWMTYQQKTMIKHMLKYFIEKADDQAAKKILTDLHEEISPYIEQMAQLFQSEGVPTPIGFTEQDINIEVPRLYENGFDIMFVRMVKEISMAMHTLNITMSYRDDIIQLYRNLTSITQKYYHQCTKYLLEQGLIPRSPYVSTTKNVEFVKDTNYLGGFNPISGKRSLNTVELAHIYHAIESNVTGMQMIFGFAQSAENKDVRKFFTKGGELAQAIIKEMSEVILENNIPVPATAGGNYTTSTLAPFSDKIMMYCISLFCSFSLGGNSVGTAFSLRNDLPAKFSIFMKDIFEYAHEGAKIMIKHGWMEEPPQTVEPK
ncbi:hypothetical protein QE429_001028 [Bacillus sp. SORGH_AS 510]|uniref:DUF3231 family protein n=1 Tax=Bacillus sp. SORGH_AS_0510 TaxID=3041771 RepID=UPI0027807999|nr:DUF3231 family protein [Bacillus sp. SORGH_AS_0510]MDQ1144201.1 hypothetical protein [Bacillus sp. SORGH_AS_0510]